MAQFQVLSPAVEVNGETVASITAGMGAFVRRAETILAAEGIKDPRPGQWYRQDAWLRAFKAIAEGIGENTLFRIGTTIPANAQFPPEIDTIEKAMAAIDQAYHMNHRGGPIGEYAWRSTGPRSGLMVCRNPYPCDFDRGIIEAMAKRFKPAGGAPRIAHDASRPCRKKGAEDCTYSVSW